MEREAATKLTEDDSEDHRKRVLKEEIDLALEKICKHRRKWLFMMFLLSATPGIMNGMHLMAYVFYVDDQPYYCKIPELERAGWTGEQIRNVSLPDVHDALNYGCEYYDYDYSRIANQSYEEALESLIVTKKNTKTIPCQNFVFENNDSVISEWNLVCDRFIYRSNVQAAFAIGKFMGASSFGIISDKYGRRFSFTMASLCYVFTALLAPFTTSYTVFLIVRFLNGISGTGCYYTIYTLLTEILVGPSRTLICCLFNASYPVGMILLSLFAYHVRHWRYLQLFMSIPTIVLPFYYWILPESPKWLQSKNRHADAWKFIEKIDNTLKPSMDIQKVDIRNSNGAEEQERFSFVKKALLPFTKLASLCSTSTLRKRTLICFFAWFTVATTYFGIALNGQNLDVGRYLYIFLNGILEILSYILPIPFLNVYGRKTCAMLIFTVTGVSLISIMFLPRSFKLSILIIALLGRFCDSSAYVILPMYTAELFPTTLRNTALGASGTMSHLGTLMSPYIVDLLGAYVWYIPSTIFGTLCIFTIFLVALLPETKNRPTYNTVNEMNQAKKTTLILEHRNGPL